MRPRRVVKALPTRPAAHVRQGMPEARQPRRHQRGPLRAVPYDHKEHTIPDDDIFNGGTNSAHFAEQRLDDLRSYRVADDDRPVTVADLLDLAAAAHSPDWSEWDGVDAAFICADDDVQDSFTRIQLALEGDIPADRLSPEERAEFDRRTT